MRVSACGCLCAVRVSARKKPVSAWPPGSARGSGGSAASIVGRATSPGCWFEASAPWAAFSAVESGCDSSLRVSVMLVILASPIVGAGSKCVRGAASLCGSGCNIRKRPRNGTCSASKPSASTVQTAPNAREVNGSTPNQLLGRRAGLSCYRRHRRAACRPRATSSDRDRMPDRCAPFAAALSWPGADLLRSASCALLAAGSSSKGFLRTKVGPAVFAASAAFESSVGASSMPAGAGRGTTFLGALGRSLTSTDSASSAARSLAACLRRTESTVVAREILVQQSALLRGIVTGRGLREQCVRPRALDLTVIGGLARVAGRRNFRRLAHGRVDLALVEQGLGLQQATHRRVDGLRAARGDLRLGRAAASCDHPRPSATTIAATPADGGELHTVRQAAKANRRAGLRGVGRHAPA